MTSRRVSAVGLIVACIAIGAAPARASDPPAAGHAPATAPATPKPVETATPAPSPRPAAPARVDEVMGRVRKLIAAYEKEVLPEAGNPAAPAKRSAPTAAPPSPARVALVWRATLVWPVELLEIDVSDRWD